MGLWFTFDENPDRDDSDLTPRERRALHEENNPDEDAAAQVIADRARQAEAQALRKWFKL
jgi:hypothetical protein